jgi:monoamine oxidase
MSYYVREPRGGAPTTLEAMAAAARALRPLAEVADDGRTLAEVVAGSGVDSAAAAAILARVTISCAYPADRLAAHAVLDAAASFDPLPTYRVAGGNQSLATGIARELDDRIHLAEPVLAISHDRVAQVHTGTTTYAADAVLLTIPLALLPGLTVTPELPEWKKAAWARLGIGHAAKLHVALSDPAAASAVLSVPDVFWTWVATDATGVSQPIAHCFSGSDRALAGLQVDRGPARWRERLADLRPELSLGPQTLLTTWSDDPWARMAYSALVPGSIVGDPGLSAPVGPIYFAGEHTAGEWASLMEGALRSGERAAAEILASW